MTPPLDETRRLGFYPLRCLHHKFLRPPLRYSCLYVKNQSLLRSKTQPHQSGLLICTCVHQAQRIGHSLAVLLHLPLPRARVFIYICICTDLNNLANQELISLLLLHPLSLFCNNGDILLPGFWGVGGGCGSIGAQQKQQRPNQYLTGFQFLQEQLPCRLLSHDGYPFDFPSRSDPH